MNDRSRLISVPIFADMSTFGVQDIGPHVSSILPWHLQRFRGTARPIHVAVTPFTSNIGSVCSARFLVGFAEGQSKPPHACQWMETIQLFLC